MQTREKYDLIKTIRKKSFPRDMAMISCESDQVLKCTKSLNQPLQSVPTSVFALDPKLAKVSLKVEMQTNWSHHLQSKKNFSQRTMLKDFLRSKSKQDHDWSTDWVWNKMGALEAR
jgi:hypothetical protein